MLQPKDSVTITTVWAAAPCWDIGYAPNGAGRAQYGARTVILLKDCQPDCGHEIVLTAEHPLELIDVIWHYESEMFRHGARFAAEPLEGLTGGQTAH